jgi:hypothetical protein
MKNGICHVCGKLGPLSFEHIPPRSTGNDHAVQIYSGEEVVKNSLTGSDDVRHLKWKSSQKGMGFYSLCESCNNYLGQNYVEEFNGIYGSVGNYVSTSEFKPEDLFVHFETDRLMPLAFCKQIISNFCSTTATGSMLDCKNYLLDRENVLFPERYRLHMFVVPDRGSKRVFTGWQILFLDDGSHYSVACLCVPPFAFKLFDRDSSTKLPDLCGDMRALLQSPWGVKPRVKFDVALLQGKELLTPLRWGMQAS